MADNYLERQASRAWDMDCYYMGRCGVDAVLMAAEIGMLAKGAVDATLAVYDGLKAAVGMGSAGGGLRLVSIAGGGQTVLAPAGAAVAEGTVEGILGGVAEGSLSGFGFHTINDFLDNLAKIDADRVFGGEGGRANKIISNLGKEIDITPSTNHTTTTKNPGLRGTPNSSIDIIDSAGNIKTRRWFGSDGTQIRDVDFTNHGNAKLHPEWPHEHGIR